MSAVQVTTFVDPVDVMAVCEAWGGRDSWGVADIYLPTLRLLLDALSVGIPAADLIEHVQHMGKSSSDGTCCLAGKAMHS